MPDDLISASAAFAVARIRLRRRDRARAALGEVAAAAGMVAVAALPWVWMGLYGDEKVDGPWRFVMVPAAMLFAAAIPMMLGWVLIAAWRLLLLALRLPWLGWWLLRLGAERAAEAELLAAAEIPAGWEERTGAWLRRRAVARLLELEPELVRDPATRAIRPLGAIPSRCASCGAGMEQIGPGLRRCGHCGYGRYDKPPDPSPGWAKARLTEQTSLYAQLLAAEPWIPDGVRTGAAVTALSMVCAALAGGLISLGTPQIVWVPLAMIATFAAFGVIPVGWAAWKAGIFWLARLPLRQTEREELRREVLRQVEEQGAATVEELAERLDLSPARVAPEVLALVAAGDLPVYHDRAAHRLISRFCQGLDTRCPACAGAVAPGPDGLRCVNCGAVALPLRAVGAQGERSADTADDPKPTGHTPTPAPPLELQETPPAEPELTILLDTPSPGSSVEAGGEVRGRIRLRMPADRRCDRVEVELQRRMTGDKPTFDTLIYTTKRVLLEHREVIGAVEEAFTLPVPIGARSWAGKIVSAEWRVYARLLPDKLAWYRVIKVGTGRHDPADPAQARAVAEAQADWRTHQRSEKIGDAFLWTLIAALFIIPCFGVWAVMAVGTVELLLNLDVRGLGLGVVTGLIALGGWEMVREWAESRVAQLLVSGEAEVPPVLWAGQTVEIPARLRGWITGASWELQQAQHSGYTVKVKTKNGTSDRTRWTSGFYWYAKGDLLPRPGPQTIRLTVPEDIPGTVVGGMREIQWSLILRLTSGRWKRSVSIPVLVLPLKVAPAGSPAGAAQEQQRPPG